MALPDFLVIGAPKAGTTALTRPWLAMRRIRDLIPAARLIAIIRNPVERAHSNWTHLWSAGLEPVGDFIQACEEEDRRIAAGWASFWHYTGLGRYGDLKAHQHDRQFALRALLAYRSRYYWAVRCYPQ